MDESQIADLIRHRFDIDPLAITHLTFGHSSVSYDVRLPDRSVIVRTHPDPGKYATTERNIRTLAGLGLPVQTIVAADVTLTDFPFAYMILEKIPGRDLRYELASMTRPQMTRLAEQIVDIQTRVGTLPLGTGCGYVGIGEHGPIASWWEFIRFDPAGPTPADEPFRRWHRRAEALLERHESYFRAVPPTCFLDDITTKNVIVENGELRGLVDFDCVCYGDPLWWLGLTATGVVSDIVAPSAGTTHHVGADALFYVDELIRLLNLTPEQHAVANLYAAMHAGSFVARGQADETASWLAHMSSQIDNWLDDASD